MATKKPRLTIYLPSEELLKDLQDIADEQQRSVSNLTSIALSDWVDSHRTGRSKEKISDDELDQFRKFIALLLGERERSGVSFLALSQALDIEAEKLHELYLMVQNCRKNKDN